MSDFIKGRCHSAKAEYPLPEDEWKRLSVKKCKSWCCTDTVRVEQAPSLRDVYTIVATSPIVVHYSKAQSHTFVADCLSAEDLGSLCLFQGCKATVRSNNKIAKSSWPIPHPIPSPIMPQFGKTCIFFVTLAGPQFLRAAGSPPSQWNWDFGGLDTKKGQPGWQLL